MSDAYTYARGDVVALEDLTRNCITSGALWRLAPLSLRYHSIGAAR